jgi:chemotaxis protein CheZ
MTDADYDAILNAVLETARGRWFVAEHMRRNRQADTALVLQAIEDLERKLRERPTAQGAERMRTGLLDMANAIARTKAEIASIRPAGGKAGKIDAATNELDAIVETTEKATSEILTAVEHIQEIAWTLREQGSDPAVCDRLNAQATEAYTACSFQDLTGQRIRRVIGVMRFLENRIDAMIQIWRISEEDNAEETAEDEVSLLNGPALPGEGLGQSEIDDLIATDRGARHITAAKDEIAREVEADLRMSDAAFVPAEPLSPAMKREEADTAAAPVVLLAPRMPSKLSARLREAIEELSPTERMALFS